MPDLKKEMGGGKYRTETGKVVDRNKKWVPEAGRHVTATKKKKPTGTAKKVGSVSRPKGMY